MLYTATPLHSVPGKKEQHYIYTIDTYKRGT